jgi:Flp pilus assembly protein TadD
MSWRVNLWGVVGLLVIALSAYGLWKLSAPTAIAVDTRGTVAEVQTVHPALSVDGQDVRGVRRLPVGSKVATGPDGRARARLDDGTTVVIDRGTEMTITETGSQLEKGRLFVKSGPDAKTELDIAGAKVFVAGATAALSHRDGKATVFCAAGEMTVRAASGAEQRVASGETASVEGKEVKVAPEAAFDDWTRGMAVPWGISGPPRRAVGEVWGRLGDLTAGNPGSPLAIRSTSVDARVVHEMALTEVRTTYFNAGSQNVTGDFRMAIPVDATVAGFAIARAGNDSEATIAVADRERFTTEPTQAQLEWAGDGWLRGVVPFIQPGSTVTTVVRYFEWLDPIDGRIQYRLPLTSTEAPPRIGEFFARVNMNGVKPLGIAAGLGSTVADGVVSLRRSDFTPSADLVVEAVLPRELRSARGYVGQAELNEEGGDYLVLRAETPSVKPTEGTTLAIVMDVSGSMEPALLDASRALVEALIEGLGTKDRIVVLSADQSARYVGPKEMGALDEARRKGILAALAELQSGGASDLGHALEQGADAIPKDAPAGMIIYVGDGRATVGDVTVDEIKARLARRAGGVPRLGAVAVGPLADRYVLSALVRGSGPMLAISDRQQAATTAVHLLTEALRPAVADVQIEFPPGVERIYPREPRALIAGDTFTAVGRFRGEMPRTVNLRYRTADGVKTETLTVKPRSAMDPKEVRRRWALSRVEELAFRAAGREAATDVAFQEGLLTPWTAWVMNGGGRYEPTPLSTRLLDLDGVSSDAYSALLATPDTSFGALTDPIDDPEEDPTPDVGIYNRAVARAAQRMILAAGKQFRACRAARAALRPELTGTLLVRVQVRPDGTVTKVNVESMSPSNADAVLNRCVSTVVGGLRFAETMLTGAVDVSVTFQLPPARSLVGRKCSPTSHLPTALRRGIWLERLQHYSNVHEAYFDAKKGCELKTWSDKRTMLELMLQVVEGGLERVYLARELDRLGEEDAATLLRNEAMRRARTPQELWAIRTELLGDEVLPLGDFRKAYRAATNDKARLGVVRTFLKIAPHHPGLRRRLFALLEATGEKESLLDEVRKARQDPLADATVLADGAAALRRSDMEEEARRAYGELVERAPNDPSVRAFLGDRLRAEGWPEDAYAAYAKLEELAADEPATLLRLALAHAQANRFDISSRMLQRLATTGGRSGDTILGTLGSHLAATQLARHLAAKDLPQADRDRLSRRALELPWSRPATVVLISTPRLLHPMETLILRGPRDVREERTPDVNAPTLGLSSFVVSPDDTDGLEVIVRRPDALAPTEAVPVRIEVLQAGRDLSEATLVTKDVSVPADGKRRKFVLEEGVLVEK